MGDGGKESAPRPLSVDRETFDKNFDKVFNRTKVRVSGVPYEVEVSDIVAELERENFMLRTRNERLEQEIKENDAIINRLTIDLANEKNKDNLGKH